MAMSGERLGDFRGVFCEKLLGASPVSKEANANESQDGHGAGQNWVQQWWWQHLCNNIFKEGDGAWNLCNTRSIQKRGVRTWERNRQPCWHQGQWRRGEGASGVRAEIPMLQQSVPDWLTPWKDPCCRSLWRLSSIGGMPCWRWGSVWRGRSNNDNVWWPDCNPSSPSPCTTQGRRQKNWEQSEAQEKGNQGVKVF